MGVRHLLAQSAIARTDDSAEGLRRAKRIAESCKKPPEAKGAACIVVPDTSLDMRIADVSYAMVEAQLRSGNRDSAPRTSKRHPVLPA